MMFDLTGRTALVTGASGGIGDEDIDPTHRRLSGRHESLDLGRVREIAGQHMNPFAQLAGQRIQRLTPCAGNGHGSTLPVQRLRDCPANAPACARDQRRPAGEIEHHFIP